MENAKVLELLRKLILVEDCIRRALDQLESEASDEAAWVYVLKQVEQADDYVTDAKCLVLASSGVTV